MSTSCAEPRARIFASSAAVILLNTRFVPPFMKSARLVKRIREKTNLLGLPVRGSNPVVVMVFDLNS